MSTKCLCPKPVYMVISLPLLLVGESATVMDFVQQNFANYLNISKAIQCGVSLSAPRRNISCLLICSYILLFACILFCVSDEKKRNDNHLGLVITLVSMWMCQYVYIWPYVGALVCVCVCCCLSM